jgi:hypothetical protein
MYPGRTYYFQNADIVSAKQKRKFMKTTTFTKITVISLLTLAGVAVSFRSLAADTAKGGAQLLLNQSSAPADLQAVPKPETAAMRCPKCRNVLVTYADTSRGGVKEFRTVGQHTCPGCQTSIEAIGHGKAKTEHVTHTCSLTTDKSCCVVK